MLLIADAGSTKCDWILLDANNKELLKTQTKGLNPSVFSIDVLKKRICSNTALLKNAPTVTKLYFYGAGCGTETPKNKLQQLLQQLFTNAAVLVKADIAAAVFAVTTKPGIVCILGTGSNCCYFDGKTIQTKIPSLGYSLMDDASGNYFGKKLLQDYFYKKMPKAIASKFEQQFDLNPDTIKINLYKKEQPNAYLASFATFIFNTENNPYFSQVIKKGLQQFFENNIMLYKEATQVPVHFIGSIAYFSSDIIKEVAKQYHFTIGKIIQKPIDGLIHYHKNN